MAFLKTFRHIDDYRCRAAFIAGVSVFAILVSPGYAQQAADSGQDKAGTPEEQVAKSDQVQAGASDQDRTATLEEIVVTASKRGAESLQRTPMAIQAISGNELKSMGATKFVDFALSVSSLQFQDLGPGDKEYIIRGINSSGASTVGVYYDEAVITGSNKEDGGGRQPDIKLYDMQRIEVLKGPQGTLYGANSLAGTIKFVTNKPNMDEFDAFFESETSGTHKGGANFNLDAMFNAPVIPGKLAIRGVGWITDDSGFIDAVRIPSGRINNINTDNTEGGRIMARLVPSENLVLTVSATFQDQKSLGSSRFTPAGETSFDLADLGFPAVPGGDLINTDIAQSPHHEKLRVYSLTGEYQAPVGTVTFTTNYFKRDFTFVFDTSPFLAANPGFKGALPFPFTTKEPRTRTVWSNEVRFASDFDGPVQVLIGGFYQRDETNFIVQTVRIDNFGLPQPFSSLDSDDAITTPTGNTIFGRVNDMTLKDKAVFGDVDFHVTDQLTLTGGFRYFNSRLSAIEFQTHPFFGFGGPPVFNINNTSVTQHKVTKRFNISYTPSNDLLFYATASQGFRVGGLNPADLPFAGGQIPRGFNPDSLWNFETGGKINFWNGRARFNMAGFVILWQDLQLESRTADGIFPFISNFGKARVSGMEFELAVAPVSGLQINLNGSYQRARLRTDTPDLGNPASQGLAGDRIPNIPVYQGHASVDYSFPIGNNLTGAFRTDISYHGKSKTEFGSRNPFNVNLDDYFLVNIRTSIDYGQWTFTAFIENVTDKRAQFDGILSEQDGKALLVARPRTGGVSLSYSFR